jgi:phage antirepressor YoqD-like protein
MNQLVNMQVLTMSSIDLRDMINEERKAAGEPKVRNDQFLSRVEDELVDELEGVQKYCTLVHGNQVDTYDLTLDQCMLVGMRESKAVRRKVLAKLKSLEAPNVVAELPNFSDPVASARAWADATEQKQIAQQALAIAAPKAEFVDRYVESSGLKGFRQVAKLLRIKENLFRSFLSDQKIMYQISGEWVPYANHIDAGRFEVKTGTAEHNDHAFTSAKFTPRGIEYVARLLRDSKKIEPEKALRHG